LANDHTFDLICMGRSSLDLFGSEIGSSFADLSGFKAYVGGSPTNICVAGQRLGLNTAMLTGVGDDYVSGFILKFLQKTGVNTDYIVSKSGYHTNAVMVALQPPESMEFVAYHINNADLAVDIDDVMRTPIPNSRVLLFNGMGLLKDPSRSATQFAAEYARAHGTKVMMDLDFRDRMWPDPRVYGITVRMTMTCVDSAIGTDVEVCKAAGVDDLDRAIPILLDKVNEALIVKRGAAGSTVYTVSSDVHQVAAFPVGVVNFLGAGDAFAGGFIYGYLNGWEIARAARFGNACGAMIVSEHGTANAMPTYAQVMAFMEARGGF